MGPAKKNRYQAHGSKVAKGARQAEALRGSSTLDSAARPLVVSAYLAIDPSFVQTTYFFGLVQYLMYYADKRVDPYRLTTSTRTTHKKATANMDSAI